MKAILLGAKKYLTWTIPIMIVLGLVSGAFMNVRPLKVFVDPILFLMVFPMMLNVKLQDILEVVKSPKAIAFSVIINFTIAPVLAYVLGRVFLSSDPMLVLGMILTGLLPTSGMTASWTGLAGGKVQSALVMMTVNLLIAMVAIPVYLKWLFASEVTIQTLSIVVSLFKVVILPLIMASLVRNIILSRRGKHYFKELKPYFGGLSALGVMAIVWLAIALKAKTILSQPLLTFRIMVPLLVFYAVLIGMGAFMSRFIPNIEERPALVFGTALRNLTIALGMSLSVFGESLAILLIAIAYVVQLPAALMYMKYYKELSQSTNQSKERPEFT